MSVQRAARDGNTKQRMGSTRARWHQCDAFTARRLVEVVAPGYPFSIALSVPQRIVDYDRE
uniref:hypothetical protein n=1 Tax=Burkholderia sp. M701 TaxID=326454 RepID=UPI00159EBD0C|nr:hypothetical protein [Burkholderia sp. M701]